MVIITLIFLPTLHSSQPQASHVGYHLHVQLFQFILSEEVRGHLVLPQVMPLPHLGAWPEPRYGHIILYSSVSLLRVLYCIILLNTACKKTGPHQPPPPSCWPWKPSSCARTPSFPPPTFPSPPVQPTLPTPQQRGTTSSHLATVNASPSTWCPARTSLWHIIYYSVSLLKLLYCFVLLNTACKKTRSASTSSSCWRSSCARTPSSPPPPPPP